MSAVEDTFWRLAFEEEPRHSPPTEDGDDGDEASPVGLPDVRPLLLEDADGDAVMEDVEDAVMEDAVMEDDAPSEPKGEPIVLDDDEPQEEEPQEAESGGEMEVEDEESEDAEEDAPSEPKEEPIVVLSDSDSSDDDAGAAPVEDAAPRAAASAESRPYVVQRKRNGAVEVGRG